MMYLLFIVIVTLISLMVIPFCSARNKGLLAVSAVALNAVFSTILVFDALYNGTVNHSVYGGYVFGEVAIRIDALSAWFLMIMNFTALTSVFYGIHYIKAYSGESSRLTLHFMSFVLNHFAMISIYMVQNTLAFLCFWEIMAITAFMMVIFEHHKMETLKAGINYLIQSHICILFLMLGFIWVNFKTGSFDFNAIAQYSSSVQPALASVLYFIFFIGFSFKAGFVPFHTWLPYAHPAAPSHVSGLMSGVIIKLGIYGILRMLLLIPMDYILAGAVIIIISVISGIYGVMLAILQHNLKRMLAYHSIENIGIIGIGIGLGSIGKGMGNHYLEFAGFAGALLHTLNHSLFKSLLFYTAGSVYQATNTLNVERLGGLIKKLPHTSLLFLLASTAICGLPPFNGFISEFLIYSGLFNAINLENQLSFIVLLVLSTFGLVLIGGLAFFCFTKAFSVAFLGLARNENHPPFEETFGRIHIPGYVVAFFIVSIGLFPQLLMPVVSNVILLFSGNVPGVQPLASFLEIMQKVSISSSVIITLVILIYFIRKRITTSAVSYRGPTWGCAYEVASPKFQYTSASFSRSFRNLVKPLLRFQKHEERITSIVPQPAAMETHVIDSLEYTFVNIPVRKVKSFLGRFKFLQNGSVQFYILYGVVFILIAIAVPLLIHITHSIIDIFKQL